MAFDCKRNSQLPEMPPEEVQRREKIDMETEMMVCPCFFYKGYKIPDDVWCSQCMAPKMVTCIDCSKQFKVSLEYEGKRPLCKNCRNKKNKYLINNKMIGTIV